MAARGRHRSKARHGNLARRGPRHDRAWRQGAGSSGRHHGRHHVVAIGHAAPAADPPAAGNGGEVMVWAGSKADDPAAVATARTAMLDETEHEYRRLLYVAMTRAADRLIVGGCMPGNRNSVRKYSWYDLDRQGSRQFRTCMSRHRDAGRPDQALHAAEDGDSRRRVAAAPADSVADRVAAVAARRRRRRKPVPISLLRPSDPSTTRQIAVRSRRIDRSCAHDALAARHAGASAAAIAARPRRPNVGATPR